MLIPFFLLLGCAKMPPSSLPPLPQQSTVYKAKVDTLANQLTDNGWMNALSIALIHPNGIEYYNYGQQSAETPLPPTQDSIYEIGSVSKVFTSLILADLVVQNKVPLEAPLTDWSLKDWKIPSKDNVEISALHLSTHTSGLPRLPFTFVPQNWADPYAEFGPADLKASLSKTTLATTPGEKNLYSNVGTGLLGYALTQKTGKSYQELLSEHITEPLQLQHTSVEPTEENSSLRIPGHDMSGAVTPDWNMPTLIGMGEINSSASDLLRFLSVQLDPSPTSIAKAIQKTQESYHETEAGFMGLGWHNGIDNYSDVTWHTGGTGGARSFVGFSQKEGFGVVVLNNNATPFNSELALSLIAMLKGEERPLKLPNLVDLTAEELSSFEGTYSLSPELSITFTANKHRLIASIPMQPSVAVYPVKENLFISVDSPIKFEFERSEDGTVSKMFLHQNDNRIPAPKAIPQESK